jgi:endonuclease/exonuclease/phosphatase family metal-dependent hydrolase
MPTSLRSRAAPLLVLVAVSTASLAEARETLRVMTFNIWVGGESSGLPLSQSLKVIQQARADLVGIQESHGARRDGERLDAARKLAKMLGWHYVDQGKESTAILSRYPIVATTPKRLGAAVELPAGRRVWLFNVHFAHSPYQPYQLLKIPYNDAPFIDTEAQAVAEARQARGQQVDELLAEIESVSREHPPLFLTGDFNEPSSLDWTPSAAAAKACPIAVRWPASARVLAAGLVDAYRVRHPDPLQARGHTWTPLTSADDPNDRHDRIDFVFASGTGVRIANVEIVGESRQHADLVVAPYPSDHRAVVATFEFE